MKKEKQVKTGENVVYPSVQLSVRYEHVMNERFKKVCSNLEISMRKQAKKLIIAFIKKEEQKQQ